MTNENLAGWVILDKPVGVSSNHYLQKLRRLLGKPKAGHAGTLDPLASGVLPVAIGEATKVIKFAQHDTKEYVFTLKFGASTTTDDLEGEVNATSEHIPSAANVESTIAGMCGIIEQAPPIYSAIKVSGKRMCDMARQGEDLQLPTKRQVELHEIKLQSFEGDSAIFKIKCGKGFYVRSLARDLAISLGSLGHVTSLRRTKVGVFSEEMAISLDIEPQLIYRKLLLPLEFPLDDIPAIQLGSDDADKVRHGLAIRAGESSLSGEICAYHNGKMVAYGNLEQGVFKPLRVLNQ